MPWSVCTTSGWNCRPYTLRSAERTAANGQLSDVATVSKPRASAVTRSPWLIQTVLVAGTPLKSGSSASLRSSSARPNSRAPAASTRPPSSCMRSCMP